MSEQNQSIAEAIEAEKQIADEAAEIRGDATELDAALFLRLYPLLCRPIPAGFIQQVGVTKGKPYESTGIRSVQVQIDRMNNVLTPLGWHDETSWEDGGKLAQVTVYVGYPEVLLARSSRGGVGQGSGIGNIYKGSYTNAAKLAFARLGPGHEVYLGAADLDPDVNQQVAEQASGSEKKQPSEIGPGIAGKLVNRAWEIDSAKSSFQLAASHAFGKDVGDCSTKKAAVEGIAGFSFDQAEKLDRWIAKKEDEAGVDESEADDG